MSTIIPFPSLRRGRPPLDVGPLAYVLARMEPDLRELILPGESWEELMTRRQAEADILDELLAEYAEQAAEAGEFAEAVSG
ncbi:hypothetical protein Ssi03_76930 [Sphaerisporangium siamense]|uniref:Uncharacterized protein n=1 Tax=Sphaerisporangium siamense TaxID=795645 RepID=A0A7W7GF88_9ACTN|nr:hypothetical protein [Sphaerisporangium siamense]MBB4706179.1 hypothetical protein [Sphaerisporangium siamense]GII89703.1 hypothetical protein Ssi03_76930 [Sphaerisporangium siamense]